MYPKCIIYFTFNYISTFDESANKIFKTQFF